MSLIEYLRSPYEITVEKQASHAVLDFLVRFDIPFYHVKAEEETVSFRLYPPYFREYEARRRERRFAGEKRKRIGFSVLLARYHKRAGLWIGGVLGLFLLFFSSRFVWDITVSGNETIPESMILEALEKNGLMLGSYIPSMDTERLEGILALSVDGISFVSINLRGTVAEVELREREKNTEAADLESPSNLIAKADGQISALEITGGVAKVKLGQIIKKGDLLASGMIDSAALGCRFVRARGEVYARTSVALQAEIPLNTVAMQYTGRKYTEKSIKFFSKTIKLFRKDSFSYENYDTIEEERRICLFGKVKLPIVFMTVTYAEYEQVSHTLTEEEALQKAKEEIRKQSDLLLADAEILAHHTKEAVRDGVLYYTDTAECILNIAEEVKIEVSDRS